MHWYVWHDFFTHGTWLIHTCDITQTGRNGHRTWTRGRRPVRYAFSFSVGLFNLLFASVCQSPPGMSVIHTGQQGIEKAHVYMFVGAKERVREQTERECVSGESIPSWPVCVRPFPSHTLSFSLSLLSTHFVLAAHPLHTLILSLLHTHTHALCAESPIPAHTHTLSHTHTHNPPHTLLTHSYSLTHTYALCAGSPFSAHTYTLSLSHTRTHCVLATKSLHTHKHLSLTPTPQSLRVVSLFPSDILNKHIHSISLSLAHTHTLSSIYSRYK